MKKLDLAIHLEDNLIEISETYFDGKTFNIEKFIQTEAVFPIFSNQSEKVLIDEAKLIEKLVNDLKFRSKNVRVIIPDNVTFSQMIELPLLSEKELLSAVKYQAEQIIPIPIDDAAIDLSIIEENKKENRAKILVVAAPINLINFITRLVEESGLIPEVIENEISAFSRFITEIYSSKITSPLLIYNLGYQFSSLYFYHPQKNLITDINIFNIGYYLFLKELKVNLNFDNNKSITTLKEIGITDDAPINTRSILTPTINEIYKNINNFLDVIKKTYQLANIDQISFINQSFLIKNFEKEISKIVNCHNFSLTIETKPIITNPQSLVFNLAQYKKT